MLLVQVQLPPYKLNNVGAGSKSSGRKLHFTLSLFMLIKRHRGEMVDTSNLGFDF